MTPTRRRILQLSPCVAAAVLGGCSSTPPAQYYRIAPLPGTPLQTSAGSVQVRDIGVPGYLDQTGIAEPSGQYRFASAANDLWAEPLGQMLQSVLVQNLAQRLPQMTVTASSGMVGTPAELLVEIDVLRFDPDASGRISLNVQAALKRTADGRFLSTRTYLSSATPAGTDMSGMMAAMSALWAGLADAVAQGIFQNSGG